jgi:hypothetical protein
LTLLAPALSVFVAYNLFLYSDSEEVEQSRGAASMLVRLLAAVTGSAMLNVCNRIRVEDEDFSECLSFAEYVGGGIMYDPWV